MKRYAVLLPKILPQELLVMFDGYIHLFHEQNFLLCQSFENLGAFSLLEVMHKDKTKKTWKVQVQTQYVLAVSDMADSEGTQIGFLS